MIKRFVFLSVLGMFSVMPAISPCRAAESYPYTALSKDYPDYTGAKNLEVEFHNANVSAWKAFKQHPYEKVPAAAMLLPPPNHQDCPDAIPICQDVYSTVVSYSGTGNIPNEINPANSCLANGERNDVWYTFTVQTSGNLDFLITPVDSIDDYDWAVYNLTTANCSDIYSTPALMKSCNYSLTPGTTGPNGGSASNNQGAVGSPYNAVIPVVAGQTYVINVSNFSASASGFTIDFTASTAQIYDNVAPQLQSIATPVSCGATSITANFSENILCSTLQNGDFSLIGPGGPYTITGWSTVGCTAGASYDNTVTVTFSPAITTTGNYDFCLTNTSGSVTDLCGNVAPPACINFTINGVTTSISGTNVSCYGGSNGTATVNAAGGSGVYVYTWAPSGGSSSTATGLSAGTYTVTVTDGSSCSSTATIVIVEPGPYTANISASVNVSCFGGNNGSATAGIAGGTAPVSYNWSNGSTNQLNTGLAAGTYTVTATDNNGCTATASVSITEPPDLQVSIVGADASCNGVADGSGTVNVSGGVPAYSYLWSNGSTVNPTSFAAGTYTVTVTDANGCAESSSVNIAEPTAIVLNSNSVDASCGGTNGSATVNANGGSPGYSYSWSNGATTAVNSSLAAGPYDVTVTDANGCTAVTTVIVGSTSGPSAVISASTDVTCNGNSDGTATVNPNGGALPYSFLWSNGETTATASNLIAGNYSVTVTDANGCIASASGSINEPAALVLNMVVTDVLCSGGNNGDVTVNVNGGTTPYAYAWSNGNTSSSNNNISAGNYTVTVTDDNGCSVSGSVSVAEPSPLALVTASTDVLCNGGSDGLASVVVNGGTGPYDYLWSDGNTSDNISGLGAGSYTVTVTDMNGCTSTASVTINEPSPIVLNTGSTDASCGSSNGSASVNANGGTPGYSYLWSDGSTNAANNNIASGPYNITVTDAAGCIMSATVNVGNTAGPVAAIAASTDVTCNGGNDGTASVNVNGGVAPYSYLWTNGSTTAFANAIPTGNQSVTVTDANGCVSSVSVMINEPTALSLNTSGTDILCNGGNTGGASVVVNGGTPSYTYNWSNGNTNDVIANLVSGSYTVTVTDNNGCSATSVVVVTEPPVLSLTPASTDISCNGGSNGTASVNANGGTNPYSYLWSNGDTNDNISNLSLGSYTVTVTDASGCTEVTTAVVNEPAGIVLNTNSSPAACGTSNGSASVIANGGTPGYTYLWSDGTTNDVNNGIVSGSYDVTVTDAAGCTMSATVNVGNTVGPVATISASTDVSCNSGSDGSASVNVNGGVAPYAYLWANGSTTSTASNVPAGNQVVTVTDANGCISSASVIINEPTAINLNTSGTDILCNGNSSGDASVVVSGGISPYLYLWSNGSTNDVITGLNSGNYSVTVTDDHGCTSVEVVIIAEPPALVLLPASTDANCYGGSDGSASVVSNGGTGPYNYLWTTGSTDDNIGNQATGTYTVTVTDASGCTESATAQINEPSQLVLNTAETPANCGSANGTATVNVSGGTPGYTYLWSNGETTTVNNSLAAGPYDITVTDSNGCTQIATVNVPNTAGPVANISASADVTCNGFSDGSATVMVNGGTAPYSFLWSDGTTTTSISNVIAGNYAVTITDGTGCVASAAVLISEPSAVILNMISTDVLCNGGNTGDATVFANGGVLPYAFLWSSGGTNDMISNISVGSYTVTVTDSSGCASTGNVNISEPAVLSIIDAVTTVSCNGGNDGSVSVVVNGGVNPYDYSWSTGSTDDNISNLIAGTYTVTTTDFNGCTLSIAVVVGEPSAIILNTNTTPAACGTSNGSATVAVNGGSPGYSYLWSNGETSASNNNLAAGPYDVTVTDSNGCVQNTTANVSNTAGPVANITASNDVSCNGGSDGAISVNVNGGSVPYVFLWSNGATTGSLNNIPAGNYSLTITDAIGCASSVSLLISEPAAIVLNENITDVICNGSATGVISVLVNGGVQPYSFSWSNGDTNSALNNVMAGNYTVTVTDSSGCSTSAVYNITQPIALGVVPSATDALCNGSSDGSVSAVVNGGTGPYGYLWSQGDTSNNVSGLPGGTYTVTVTDANGCTLSATTIINNPAAITIGKTTVSATCGSSNGSATAIPNGGTAPYSYLWSNGATTAVANNIPAGAYQVNVTDAMGCTASRNITVTNSSGPVASIAATVDVTCYGGVDGSVNVNVNSGSTYTYLWSNGDTTPALTNIPAGNYTITVTDDNGCQSSVSTIINEPTALILNTAVTDVLCNGGNTGAASVIANGSVSPYSYLWTGGSTSDILSTVTASTYTVTVTDDHGCTASSSVVISEPPVLVLVPSATDASCNGSSDGGVSVNVNGGSNPYAYLWSNAATIDNVPSLTAGIYTISVTDNNGCTLTATAVVNEPAAITIGKNTVAAICGSSNGSATAIPNGGTNPYSYLWSNGGTTNVINGIPAGNYQVTVTDANGCTNSRNINVPNSAGPVASIASFTDVSCFGGSDGSATLNVNSGLVPYTYLWSDGSTAATLNGVMAGNYSVTVTDANACATAASVLISEPTLLVINEVVTDVLCNGGSSGSLTLAPSGAVSPYSYVWSNGDTNNAINNIPAGNYTVMVTDDHGCTMTSSMNINEPPVLTALPASTDATCNGGNDGSVSVIANGGTGPYAYLWTTGDSAGSIPGLTAGTYTVTVTDANGSTITASASVNEPAAIVINNTTVGAICGASNGSATAIPSGGAGPYSFIWDNGSTSAVLQNVPSGSYTVTVTDSKGCTVSAGIAVPNAVGPVPTVVVTNISCYGLTDGSAIVQTVGGAAPYTYLWSNGDTLINISGLDTGSYTVTVTDNNGCVSSASFSITEPLALTGTLLSQDVLCNGGNSGWAHVTGTGGSLPFNFLWSNGSIADSIFNLSANTFTTTITDANGCTTSMVAIISEPAPLILGASSTDASCNGLSNGTLLAQVSGGTNPYSYLWSNAGTTSGVPNVPAGAYTVTVTDGNGCVSTATTSVLEPPMLSLNYQTVSSTCGAANGSAGILVSGGSPSYLYSWSNGATGSSISGIIASTYTVTVTDQHSCSLVEVIQVGNMAGPAASISASQDATCKGALDGSATAAANGGALPLSFAWSNGETTSTIINLAAGSYTVTITDFNSCVATTSVIIGEPASLIPNVTHSDALCFGTATGIAIVSSSGGTAPYQYTWSNNQTSDTITALVSGTYSVTITDSHACTATASVSVSQPAILTSPVTSTPALCFGSSNGVAQVNAAGGTPPYSYNWSNGSTLFAANGLIAGNYSVTVTDGNGCVSAASIAVGQAAALNIQSSVTPVLCHGGNTGAINIAVTGGTTNYNYQWSSGSANGPSSNNLFAGTYTVTVTDAHNCTQSSVIQVSEPDLIVLTPALTNVTCFGLNNGTASVVATGGVVPYTYSWTNGVTTMGPLTNLTPGIYSVLVTDNNSCTCFASLQIQQPTQLILNAYGNSTICIGQPTSISAIATGGTGNYNFSWSNGVTNQNQVVSPPATTTYTVNVTDANNCTTTKKTVLVTVFPALGVVASGDAKICDGENVAVWAQASGGNGGPYTYSWSNNAGNTANIVVSPQLTTTYTVTASDNCGTPVAQTTVTVFVHPLPVVEFEILPEEGCVPLIVNFKNLSTTSLKAHYLWNFGDGNSDTLKNPEHVYLREGTYDVSLQVTSDEGCVSSLTKKAAIHVYGLPVAAFTADPAITSILHPQITFTDKSSGASFWDWDFGDGMGSSSQQHPRYLYQDTGSFEVRLIVENIHTCTDTISEQVIIEQDFTLYIPNAFTPNNDGTNDLFMLKGMGVNNLEVLVFDRWGKRVFYGNSIDDGWNGRQDNRGVECQQDAYVYLVKVINFKGEPKEFTGTVTLIR